MVYDDKQLRVNHETNIYLFGDFDLAEKCVYLLFGIINFESGGGIIIIYGDFVSPRPK